MKKIIKTKIIGTASEETGGSKKKGKFLTALAAGLFGTNVANEQDKWHSRHKKENNIVTFLIIYDDETRETADCIKDDDNYKKYIMYLD